MNPAGTGASGRPGNGAPTTSLASGPTSLAGDAGTGSSGLGGIGASVPAPGGTAAREAAIAPGGPTGPGTMVDDGLPPQGATHDWGRANHDDDPRRTEFGAFLDDLSELARGGPADLRGELERRVSRARDRFGAAYDLDLDAAREQVRRGLDYSRDAVVERPLSALAIAALGGLLLGLLLARRSS